MLAEEMLHLALAANLLNAVGGEPKLDSPELLPPFPHPLPHGDRSIEIDLVPFGPKALDLFLRIEQPAAAERRRRPTSTRPSGSSTPRSRPACVGCATNWARPQCSAAPPIGR